MAALQSGAHEEGDRESDAVRVEDGGGVQRGDTHEHEGRDGCVCTSRGCGGGVPEVRMRGASLSAGEGGWRGGGTLARGESTHRGAIESGGARGDALWSTSPSHAPSASAGE